jgi:hypothetical protein
MKASPPILTPEEEEALRAAQLIGGGIGHADPKLHQAGMESLAERVTTEAASALINRVKKWQGYNLLTKWFEGMSGAEIARLVRLHPGNVSKLRSGKMLASIETIIEAKWASGDWGALDLPPRCDVNEAIFSAAAAIVIPALGCAREDVTIPDAQLSKQEVELIGILHLYARQFLAATAEARKLTSGERASWEKAARFVTQIRRHLERLFHADLPRAPLLGSGDPIIALRQMSQFFADWTYVWQWVNELLERRYFGTQTEPIPSLSDGGREAAAL